ncbi:hypothetical protein BDZ91DRAFT_708359 [Kalaharituber pfeilii]|nr:hypothetical protein BDZ91DRAFT_708359 [Kalaharituber pfeilii]
MEEISNSIKYLTLSAGHQINQLAESYDAVVGRLQELEAVITRFTELQKSTAELIDTFTANEEKFQVDIKAQIKSLGAYQDEIAAIRVLQGRLDLQRRAVEMYKSRLEQVESKIGRQKELEIVWRQRASRRLRILWGIISVLVILWLLATSTHDSYQGMEDIDDVDEQATDQQYLDETPSAGSTFFEYGTVPKNVLSLEAERVLRERHRNI